MRIAHVSDFYLPRLGGIELHIAELAARQRQLGHHVDVVTATGGAADLSRSGALIAAAADNTRAARFRPRTIAAASRIIKHGGYDVVHVHAGVVTPLSFTVAAQASRAGLPTVVTAHSLISHLQSAYRGIDVVTQWTKWPVAWTAVSALAAAPLQRLVGWGTAVSVLPNAINVDVWRIDPTPRAADHVLVAAVGRLAARKRPLQLLRALRRVRRMLPDGLRLSAVLVGDGQQRGTLERYLTHHGMHGWVSLPGWSTHDQIRDLFRRADLFVAPAHLESFGIAALEARAAGLPVVAMARAGIGEFIEHGRSGLLVDDDAAMVDALARLISDAPARARIAAHNATVPPPFGWHEALQRTAAAYQHAASIQGRLLPHLFETQLEMGRVAQAASRSERGGP